uniref:Cytochrome P450 CYP428A1 n=1 Tax=Zygaena filipendulae TaxID=287375 RepID=A0A286MXP1_9NEOP|nr:cytochrome P450 CYP428A1 [Zygaena filipendulae]
MASSSAVAIPKLLFSRPCRRLVSTTPLRAASTSPQRRTAPAPEPAAAASTKPFSAIPGPLALPMLRHSYHVLPRIGCFHHTVGLGLLEGLRERYGDVVRLAKASRSRPALYVFDPGMMQQVYDSCVTEPPVWERSPLRQQRKRAGRNYNSVNGDETKAVWAAIRALLQDETLLTNYDTVFDEIATDTARRLGELRGTDNALNEELETEVYRWAIETIGVMLFGIRLGCLDGAIHISKTDKRTPEKTSMDDHVPDLCSLSKRSLEELTPAERMVRCSREIADGNYLVRSEHTLKTESPTFINALAAFDRHFSLTEHFLLQALRVLNKNDVKPEQVLLDKLRPLDQRLLSLAADAFLAGVDPLAHTAVSMLHQLSLHAAQQQRAHDEVRWAAAAAAVGEGAARPAAPYVAACAREAVRLHPATGGVVRRSREPLVVGGYDVPAGVDIVLAHGVTSKSEKQWGRAKAFIPERWCKEGWDPLKASKAHPLASMPFGETCPAAGVVGRMLAALAARLLDKYRVEWHGPAPNIATTGVNKLQPPFYFVLQEAC